MLKKVCEGTALTFISDLHSRVYYVVTIIRY